MSLRNAWSENHFLTLFLTLAKKVFICVNSGQFFIVICVHTYKAKIMFHNQRHSLVAADESKFCEDMWLIALTNKKLNSLLLDITIRVQH